MSTFETESSYVVAHNGIVKFLLTTPDRAGRLLCNLPKDLVDFEEGDTIEVTLKSVRRRDGTLPA